MQQETALDEIQHEVGVEQVFMTINIDDSKYDSENHCINGKFIKSDHTARQEPAMMTKLFVCACEVVCMPVSLGLPMMNRKPVTPPKYWSENRSHVALALSLFDLETMVSCGASRH